MSSEPLENFRCSDRVGVRTPVIIYEIFEDGRVIRSRAWTDDLSTSGVKLVTENPIETDPLYIRIMLPDLKDRVIRCTLIRKDNTIADALGKNLVEVRRWAYGAKFVDLPKGSVLSAIENADDIALGRKPVSA